MVHARITHLKQSLGAVHVPDLPPTDVDAFSRMLQMMQKMT